MLISFLLRLSEIAETGKHTLEVEKCSTVPELMSSVRLSTSLTQAIMWFVTFAFHECS